MSQIFIGFEINTLNLAIRLPEQKRAGASVLFDQLFESFGSNSPRLLTLQQIRGNVEHFKSTNALWNYFTAPIDALLGCGDECGLWVMSANPDFWVAFWDSMEAIRTIKSSETQWDALFCGSLERLLPPEKRFACRRYPEKWSGRQAMQRWMLWQALVGLTRNSFYLMLRRRLPHLKEIRRKTSLLESVN